LPEHGSFLLNTYIYPFIMITSEALAKTIDNDPQFNVRILYLLSKATLPITVHEFEYLYIETFRLDFFTTCLL